MANRLPVSANPPTPTGKEAGPWAFALKVWLTSTVTEIFQFLSVKQPWQTAKFLVASLPLASEWEGAIIYVQNETGGATLAFSDGTNWRRVQDRAIVA